MRAVSGSALLLVVAVGAAGSPLAAQRRELTVFAGANYSGANGAKISNAEARTGFQAGVSLRIPRSPMLSFQTELIIIQRRFYAERAPSSLPALQAGPRADAPDLLYAQIPLLLRIERGFSTRQSVRPFLVIGAYVGVRLACKRELTEASGTVRHTDCSITPADRNPGVDPFLPAQYQDVDAGLLGDIGVEIRRLSLRVRGERSVRALVHPGAVPTTPLDKATLWSGSFSVEYLLRVL